eukprot:scaffold195736_cov27-Tisochrysis_lutea.AAC.5
MQQALADETRERDVRPGCHPSRRHRTTKRLQRRKHVALVAMCERRSAPKAVASVPLPHGQHMHLCVAHPTLPSARPAS